MKLAIKIINRALFLVIPFSILVIAANMFFVSAATHNTAIEHAIKYEVYSMRSELVEISGSQSSTSRAGEEKEVFVSHLVNVTPITVSVSE